MTNVILMFLDRRTGTTEAGGNRTFLVMPGAGELIETAKPGTDDKDHSVHLFRVVAVIHFGNSASTSVYVEYDRPADAIKIDGPHRIHFDHQAKKAEWQWQDASDIFWLHFTATWFEWVQWLLVLWALRYLANLTHSRLVAILNGIGYMVLWFYFQLLLSNGIRRHSLFIQT